jgi:DegV family protein with EDD domain
VKDSKVLPETAAPSPGAFEECFRAAAAQGATGVVCVMLSSALSATFQAAQLGAEAAKDAIEVRVVDSRSATIGEGLLAVVGAEAAAKGGSADEIASLLEKKVPHVQVFAALDTLENLKKGGRIGAAQAMLGSMLSVKPLITVTDGAVGESGKQRKRARSLERLIELAHQPRAFEATRIVVVNGDAPDVDEFVDKLCAAIGRTRDDVLISHVGSVIGTHTGPRSIGIAWEDAGA